MRFSNLIQAVAWIPYGLGTLNTIEGLVNSITSLFKNPENSNKDLLKLLLYSQLTFSSILALILIGFTPFFNILIASINLVAKVIDVIDAICTPNPTSETIARRVHDLFVSSLGLTAFCLAMTTAPIIGEIMLLVLATYLILDMLNLNPIKMLPCFKKAPPPAPASHLDDNEQSCTLKQHKKSLTATATAKKSKKHKKAPSAQAVSTLGLFSQRQSNDLEESPKREIPRRKSTTRDDNLGSYSAFGMPR